MSLAELARRVWFFLRRDRISAELAEEMRLHVELRARREREAGHDASEAQHRARRQFGNAPHLVEGSRDQWGMRWADDLMVDLKYGGRALRRAPMPSAIIVLTLAVGIGATLAMFTVMDAALFRPLPVREPEQLVMIPRLDVPMAGDDASPRHFDLPHLRSMREIYEQVGAYAAGGLNLTGGAAPTRVQAGLVTPSTLRLLGVQPVLGRIFTDDEGRPGGPFVVVLSHALWRTQFGSDPAIVGKRLSLHDRSYEIVGVMPPRFAFPSGSELWIPMQVPLPYDRAEVFRFLILPDGIARLAPGVTREHANAHYIRLRRDRGWTPEEGEPLPERHLSVRGLFVGDSEARLLMVMGLAALLLVAACANICGLLLARWSSRRREIAVRAAIGASRRRLLRQLATESAVLAMLGAAGGLLLARAGLRLFNALMPPDLAALTPPLIDGRALTAMLVLTVVAALAIGTLPSLAASRGDLTATLKSGGTGGATRTGGHRLGGALVVVEVALAVVLLVGAGLLIEHLARLYETDTGIRAEQVVTARVALSRTKYPTPEDRRHFYLRLESELEGRSELVSTGVVSALPLRGEWEPQIVFGMPDRREHGDMNAELVYASANYFETLGIRVIAGRTFIPSDTVRATAGAIVSERFARTHWPDGSALGSRMTGGGTRVIVGIVSDVRGTSLDGEQRPQVYFPLDAMFQATIVARSPLPPAEALGRIRAAVERVDPEQVVYDMRTMEDVAAGAIAEQRASSVLATIFGAITMALAALGLYGLLAFGVVQRTRELGIRFALGARRAHVVRRVVGDSVVLTVLGSILGLATAYGLMRALASQLHGMTPGEPSVYLAVPVVLLVTALLAAAIPAARAARVDPMRVLRSE